MQARTNPGKFICILLIILFPFCVCAQEAAKRPATQTKPESFWDKVLRYAGISHDASNLKAPGDEVASGWIWLADLDAGTTKKISATGGYRSPVFVPGGNQILALKAGNLVQVDPSGHNAVNRCAVPSVTKLVGFSLDNNDSVLVLQDSGGGRPTPGVLAVSSGKITRLPYDPASNRDLEMIEQLQSWERSYGDAAVYTRRQSKETLYGPVEWTDVYLKRNSREAADVSHCDGVNCGQPSLSADRRNVVFIKSDRE